VTGRATAFSPQRSAAGSWIGAAVIAAAIVWSFKGTGVDPTTLFGRAAFAEMAVYVRKLFPPDLSAGMLREAATGAAETFAISIVGTSLALLIALPLSFLTTRTILFSGILYARENLGWRRGPRLALYVGAKLMLNVLRTIPEIVWALVCVFAVGLGPFPGALALALHNGGVLGKLFGEVLEDVDARPLEALQAGGASRPTILLYGILPQAWPQFLAYALYRWEVSIRAAAILGFVGAGGLGQRLLIAISLFLDHQLLTLIFTIYIMVTVVDLLSGWLRRRVI
jgi:phosphonate transport system permease protein